MLKNAHVNLFSISTHGCDVDSEADEGTIDTKNLRGGGSGLTALGVAAQKANEEITHNLQSKNDEV